MDENGLLYFVARKDDIIKSRGEKVDPKEVENVLYELPKIREAAVVGVADPILGEAVKAIVVLADGTVLSEAAVVGHCTQRLDNYMVPKYVEFRTSLPKTASQKISKTQLRSMAPGNSIDGAYDENLQ
jgi:acyl-coenzyme A synthetase/AMP-(fatty) acid ligase